ncbi:MAG: alanine racemase [Hyphomicrobiales bacterium]|nr:alanine racemase [Hyphomicrobiales bacterium]
MIPTSLAGAPGVLAIDLVALAENWRILARRAAPGECAAVVKADAYGLGIEIAAPALYAAGCRTFFVAHLSEGRRARAALQKADARIYVLNGLQSAADPLADYAAHRLAPAVGSAEELARWAAFAAAHPAPLCAIHLDTGMNRLGFPSLDALRAAVERCGGRPHADLLMSHFVSAERRDDPLNAVQIARFEEARAAFPELAASLANSSGLFLPARPAFDLSRPGYALYGGNPTPGLPNPMRPVLVLDIAIQQTRWIEAGETCGYNSQWTARRRTRLATLLAGYADGLPSGAGATDEKAGAEVMIAGRRCPLVGRMSMDLSIADVTDVPENEAQPGGFARFLGEDIGLDEFAEASGTIGYTVLTTLSGRYTRRIVGAA